VAKGRTGAQVIQPTGYFPGSVGAYWMRPRPAAIRGEAGYRARGGFVTSDIYRATLR